MAHRCGKLPLLGAATSVALLFACSKEPTGVPASIVISSATANFVAIANGSNPATSAIAITNGGGGSLSGLNATTAYTPGQPTGWLNATLSGTTAPSTLTLAATTSTLAAGTYNATVAITASDAENTPQSISVSFTVGQAPSITLSTSILNFQATAGGANPAGSVVQITNGGGATLSGLSASITHASGQPAGWLTASLSGTTAPSTLTVTAATGSLATGTYTATVAIAAVDAANTPESVTVTFTVGQAPSITIPQGADSLFLFPLRGDGSAPIPISITNGGGGTLDQLSTVVAYSDGQGWLTATLSSTTAPSTLTLTTATDTLAVGTYRATVSVSSPRAANTAHITLTVRVFEKGIYVSQSDPSAIDNATCGIGPPNTGVPGRYPCLTITQGIARAQATGRTLVVVADGIYNEAVSLINGISLLGGYDPDTWERHLSTTNTIIQGASSIGSHDRTVLAAGIVSSTVFEGFVVRGSLNAKANGNSYAIYVSNASANLVIRHNLIYAGRAGPGMPGSTGANGGTGANGAGRASNPTAYDAKITTGTGQCNATNNRQFANGGSAVYGTDDVSGGRGGGNSCPPSSTLGKQSAADGLDGQAGAGAGGGVAGTGGLGGGDGRLESSGTLCFVPTPPLTLDGANGTSGSASAHGAAVAGGANDTGSVVSFHWLGAAGAIGTSGSNGGGGGGGAGGGGGFCLSCLENKDRLGGHGGGGGAGGQGGAGGGAGNAGGGAFGIFVVGGSAPDVHDNLIVRGEGGTGGAGGTAGAPGLGGTGAAGGLSIFCTGAGGRGGDGGSGGYGSGGGGGSGGTSFGIYTSGVGLPTYCDVTARNTISGGTGGPAGPGGSSVINPGGAGRVGALFACSFH